MSEELMKSDKLSSEPNGLKSKTGSEESLTTAPFHKMRGPRLAPMPGFTWNPLRKLPRNQQCPCMSGAKFKRCCLNRLPHAVTIEDAERFKKQMALPDLVFMMPENENQLRALALAKGKQDAFGEREPAQRAD